MRRTKGRRLRGSGGSCAETMLTGELVVSCCNWERRPTNSWPVAKPCDFLMRARYCQEHFSTWMKGNHGTGGGNWVPDSRAAPQSLGCGNAYCRRREHVSVATFATASHPRERASRVKLKGQANTCVPLPPSHQLPGKFSPHAPRFPHAFLASLLTHLKLRSAPRIRSSKSCWET
ncbi:uncharacterized protein B0I36DRAFT_44121 [Microdochium trichocladiopsis]|uniref:Uncharacterized protein n=1 Tax=Microdochium trichocladiopsis TaxID=1682393 RepID=A0A9P9BJ13_9PEZI|nr:uncharacterized protein B0I36DRAFT_44121 [Microdochium trichocladiopsis]KAH7016253.1 hypothetical protein B0I36DRAFT_44121 [Microdochium trichocladiopsis]